MVILGPLIKVVLLALDIYIFLIIASAIMSWLVAFNVINTQNQFVRMIWEFLWRITDPALRPIRRFIPAFGGVGISPIILCLIIYFIQMLLIDLYNSLVTYG